MSRFYSSPISEAVLPLWLACFPDDGEEEVRHLLSLLADGGLWLRADEDGEAACGGLLLPVTLGGRQGYYLYAIGTRPAFRGRGYLRAFLSAAKEKARADGMDFLILIPATEALSELYRRYGFTEELPLAADAEGGHPVYRLPRGLTLTPYDGDARKLYARYRGPLSFPVFCATLFSVADKTRIHYTEDGFCVLARDLEDECFTADEKTLSLCEKCPSPYRALLCPLTNVTVSVGDADPLPR